MSSLEKTIDYNGKGLTGLGNLGNTCFINAAIQCLSHTYELNDFLNRGTFKKRINKIPESLLLLEWNNLRELMWSENCIIKPAGFISAVQKVASLKDIEIFTGYAQNDLTEFLNFLLMAFHESIKREVEMNITGNIKNSVDKLAINCYKMMKNMYSKEYSEFLNMFYGIHVSKISSKESNYESSSPEPFFMLDVPIGDNKTLLESIELYTKVEILDNDNKIFNEETGNKEIAKKQIVFWNLPNILIITLKRFNNNNEKNNDMVDFPLENLDFSKYVVGYNKDSYKYDLFGICNHSGGVSGGHYTAFVKNANDSWYHFNDTNVNKVHTESIKTNMAYCFFYRKKIL
jgi:ubiquitin carboxyl-terminal hydrolase 8